MIELLLKASLAIGIALLFYKLLLQQESFFATNRLYLVGCIVLAFALPFINLPKLVNQQGYLSDVFQPDLASGKSFTVTRIRAAEKEQKIDIQYNEALVSSTPEQKSYGKNLPPNSTEKQADGQKFNLFFWLSILYLSGIGILTFSFLFQVGNIVYKISTATDKIRDGNFVIVNTSDRQAPCSFFKFIFIYPNDYDFETYEQIIAHEKTHARLGHSFDMLVAEIAVILLWFNPLIWFLKREIEKNIEYQTDAELLQKEQVRKDQYQLNLLQIAVPNKPLSITTNYNQSLIKQRITMMNTKRSSPHAYWKYAFLVPLFFGMLLLTNEPAASQHEIITPKEKNPNKQNLAEIPKREPLPPSRQSLPPLRAPKPGQRDISAQTDISSGYWYSNRKEKNYCLQFKENNDASSWYMSRCFDASAFQKENDVFIMTKETGTLQLTGNLDAEVGQGKYKFIEDASFKKYLKDNDILSNNRNLMFHLFFGDVSRDYVDFLKQEYQEIDGDRLLELAIHGISLENFKNYLDLFKKYDNKKPSIEEIVEANVHGIDEAYVAEIHKMGYKDLSLKEIMEAKLHGVTAAYVEDLKKAGFDNLPMEKIIEARIHDVEPTSIKEIQALGFGEQNLDKVIELHIHDINTAYISELKSVDLKDLTLDQVIEAKIHGLSASVIKELKEMDFKDLDFKDLVSAKIHNVNPAYVKSLKDAGFDDLPMEKIIEARIHNVEPAVIKEIQALDFGDPNFDKVIELHIHGVDAAYISDLKSVGLEDLTLDQIIEAKIHGLDPSAVRKINGMGFSDLDFKDLISAKIHDVNAAYIEDLKEAGFGNLSMENIVEAKIHGIDKSFIQEAKKNGYNLDSIDEYISLKIHGKIMESLKSKD